MCRRMEGVNLDPLDIIDIIDNSTKGTANAIVKDYLEVAQSDPIGALNAIWYDFVVYLAHLLRYSRILLTKMPLFLQSRAIMI